MHHFLCDCGNALFFENTICLRCGSEVGFDPVERVMRQISDAFRRCRNGREFGVCNWVTPADGPEYCAACRLNRTVPDPSVPGHLEAWRKTESAKRRVIYTLSDLGIPPVSGLEQPGGVLFDILSPLAGVRVTTGHVNGVITLNVLEADDLYREHERRALGEPYRTPVGHLRHEFGHYFWERLFQGRSEGDAYLEEFRALFGDEREDYAQALARHYANGAPQGWSMSHITPYAAAHPWEDWAETWAHYLHIVDGTETAAAFGWAGESVPLPFTPFPAEEVLGDGGAESDFLDTLHAWVRLSPALNEIAASLGHPTLYPFALSALAVRKIGFVHEMVRAAAAADRPDQHLPSPGHHADDSDKQENK